MDGFPTFWSAGLVTALFGPLAVGATTALQESFDPEEALHLIERERVTSIGRWATTSCVSLQRKRA